MDFLDVHSNMVNNICDIYCTDDCDIPIECVICDYSYFLTNQQLKLHDLICPIKFHEYLEDSEIDDNEYISDHIYMKSYAHKIKKTKIRV